VLRSCLAGFAGGVTHVALDLALRLERSLLVGFPYLPGFALRMPGGRGTLTIGTPIPPEVWNGRIEDVVEEVRTWAAETIARGRRDGSVPPPADWVVNERDSGAAPALP